MAETNESTNATGNEQALDERGTETTGGLTLLRRRRDKGFVVDNETFAVALCSPLEEVEAWMQASEPPDDDIIMKARGIAKEREVEID